MSKRNFEEEDITTETITETNEDNNPELSNELSLMTKEQRINKRPKILNEPIVDQDIVDDMEDLVSKADLRNMVGLKNEMEIEIKWNIEYEDDTPSHDSWLKGKIVKLETGETHRFIDEENTDDFEDVTIVNVLCEGPSEPPTLEKLCFISKHEVYNTEYDSILLWRHIGDTYDETSDDDDDDNVDDIVFEYTDETGLMKIAETICTNIFVNTLEKFKEKFEALPFLAQRDLETEIVRFKQVLVEKVCGFFRKNQKVGHSVVLKREDISPLFDEALNELQN